jgi:hypothetical protein
MLGKTAQVSSFPVIDAAKGRGLLSLEVRGTPRVRLESEES